MAISRVVIPAVPLIGPRCTHAQPFAARAYATTKRCPVCNDHIDYGDVMIDNLTRAIRLLLPKPTDVVAITDDGYWALQGHDDLFPLSALSSEEDAVAWLNTRSFEQLRELPGVDVATALAIDEHRPFECDDDLDAISIRFMGPWNAQYRRAFATTVRAHKLVLSPLCEPPLHITGRAIVGAAYERAAPGYTEPTAKIVAAIAASIWQKAGDITAGLFITAIHVHDYTTACAIYGYYFPDFVDSLVTHLTVVEPWLKQTPAKPPSALTLPHQ